jgi:hypothetical protein
MRQKERTMGETTDRLFILRLKDRPSDQQPSFTVAPPAVPLPFPLYYTRSSVRPSDRPFVCLLLSADISLTHSILLATVPSLLYSFRVYEITVLYWYSLRYGDVVERYKTAVADDLFYTFIINSNVLYALETQQPLQDHCCECCQRLVAINASSKEWTNET